MNILHNCHLVRLDDCEARLNRWLQIAYIFLYYARILFTTLESFCVNCQSLVFFFLCVCVCVCVWCDFSLHKTNLVFI